MGRQVLLIWTGGWGLQEKRMKIKNKGTIVSRKKRKKVLLGFVHHNHYNYKLGLGFEYLVNMSIL